ncbi:MAG: FAD-binding oxidoreductase [Myxococcota bacterium]
MKYARERLSWNGWGWSDKVFDLGERRDAVLEFLGETLHMEIQGKEDPVSLKSMPLPDSRITALAEEALVSALERARVRTDRFERLFHAVGKSYWDVLRLRRGDVPCAPDVVVYPQGEGEVAEILSIAAEHKLAVIPYGGGSSVVGGVEAKEARGQHGVITLDTSRMNRLLRVDKIAHTATFQAGIYGPELEDALAEHGLTLGHYPQSFEFSTLGGWIAARGSGQQSNRYGAAAKMLVAARVVTPAGVLETKPFPGSSTGPDVNAWIAGSEGILGVITQATVTVRPLPEVKDYRGFLFRSFVEGSEAVREMMHEELATAMIRLSDGDETRFFGAFKSVGSGPVRPRHILRDRALGAAGWREGEMALMVVGLEGQREQVALEQLRAHRICLKYGGMPLGAGVGESWYEGRFEMPYARSMLLDYGFGVDTLETSTPWSNVDRLYSEVTRTLHDAIAARELRGIVMAHISHSYKTGTSLYFTYVFPRDRRDATSELDQWLEIKHAASDAIGAHGGTISHHHGVGRDHMPWLEAEKGDVALAMVRAAKGAVDPEGIMNPGAIVHTHTHEE